MVSLPEGQNVVNTDDRAGWQLGSDPEIQVPNLVANHLTSGLMNYIKTTGRYASGINLFEKLRTRDPEVSSLLAQVYMAGDEEVKSREQGPAYPEHSKERNEDR